MELNLFIYLFFLFMFFITSHLQHKLEVSVQMGFWTKEKSNLLKKKKRQIKVIDCQKSIKTETFTLTKR